MQLSICERVLFNLTVIELFSSVLLFPLCVSLFHFDPINATSHHIWVPRWTWNAETFATLSLSLSLSLSLGFEPVISCLRNLEGMFSPADRLTHKRSMVQTPPKGAEIPAFQVHLGIRKLHYTTIKYFLEKSGGRIYYVFSTRNWMPVSIFRLHLQFSQNECVHCRAFTAHCRETRRR